MSCLLPGLLQGAWGKEGACQICVHAQWISHVRLFATPWTIPCQAPLSMGFSRQEYWSGLPLPSPGYLPYPGIEPVSPALAGGFSITEPPGDRKYSLPSVGVLRTSGIMLMKPSFSQRRGSADGNCVVCGLHLNSPLPPGSGPSDSAWQGPCRTPPSTASYLTSSPVLAHLLLPACFFVPCTPPCVDPSISPHFLSD